MVHSLVPVVLLPTLILVYRAGWALAAWATRERALARILAPAAALALWLLAVHVAGLISHSFYAGLFVGTGVIATAGLACLRLPRPALEPGLPLGWPALAWAVLAASVMAWIETHYMIWDEVIITGHLSIPLEMLNGIYPPRHLTFALHELRYHYGFDLLNACVAALVGQPAMRWVVAWVTAVLWGYLAVLTWAVGQRCIGAGAGLWTSACVLLGGGFPFLCLPAFPLIAYVGGHCSGGDGFTEVPPLPSNFVQHPWSLGMPIGFAALLLFQHRPRQGEPDRAASSTGWWVALTLLLALLSLSQVVFFGCALIGMALTGGFTSPGPRWRQLLIFGGWSVVVLLGAISLHGFFAPSVEPRGLRLDFVPLIANAPKEWVASLAVSLGFAIPLGLLGFRWLKTERVLLALLTALGVGIFSLFRYAHSWDMVKFLMVAQLALALGTAAFLWQLWARPRWRWLAVVGGLLVTGQGAAWVLTVASGQVDDNFHTQLVALASPADTRMIAYLRRHIGAGETVFRRDAAVNYAIRGGLPVQETDWGTASFGFSSLIWDARSALINVPHDDVNDYASQGLRWIVLGPWDDHLRAKVETWVAQGHAESRLKAPPLELFYIK